jgi:hypothetical protein
MSGFLIFFGPEKDSYLSDMKTVLLLYFANDAHMPHLLYTSYQLHDYLSSQRTE